MGIRRQIPLRMLAPAGLVLFALVLSIVIASSLENDSEPAKRKTATTERRQTGRSEDRQRDASPASEPTGTTGPRVYVVKAGDTLAAIAGTSGVPTETLLSLNPGIDPQALVTGQRIKLRE